MAKNTAISALAGGKDLNGKLVVFQRRIDFASTNLASGAHFELFKLETGDIVVGGVVTVDAGATAGNEDLTMGVGGTGTTLLTATPVDTDGSTALTGTWIPVGDDTVDLAMTVDAADQGVVDVTLLVLRSGDTAG